MQSHTLDTVGMYGRSVEDVALLTDCMAAYEPDDPTSIRRARPDIAAFASSAPPVPPRLAFVRTPAWNDADPEMRSAFEQLAAQLGDRAADIDIPVLPEVIEHQRIVQLAENAHYYGPLLDRAPQHISAGLTQRLKEGRAIDGQTYLAAIVRRDPTYNAVRDAIDGFDAILTPAALGPAPEGLGATGSPIFNGLWTYLGMPAVSVPLLTVRGLPVGVQLVGRRNDDARLLRTAAWLVKKNAG
jgi:Asp-tRNA(Asn)/Glu-tRNA(Gln) amidotransferase A subunit family amidase